MKKNKGFTLIELLAVIVILAVVSLIATPLILNVIEKAQASAYKESLRGIFSATDLYVASANFNGFPNDGINITDSNIQMKNKNFTSGKIIKNAEGKLELDKVSNGSYCGSGPIDNLVIIEGSCDSLDETAPTDVILTSNLVASNSVTIVASATDDESGISGYQFSKDNGLTWTNKQTSNIYTFTGLTNNTSYTFKVKVYNNNLLSTISNEISETTTNVEVPTYAINPTGWTKSAVVTITYPERESGYVYEYSLDEGLSWEEVASPDITKDITFTDNGSVIAKISDGTNEIVGTTYQVANIDNVAPIITVNSETLTVGLGSTYTDSGITATDNIDGDLTADIITTGTVNTSVEGTYTLTYNVSDEAGNNAIEVTRTVIVIQSIYNFTYTGNYQTFTVPVTGTYQIELWGAEGGNIDGYLTSYALGKGAYVSGKLIINSGKSITVYVGGQGQNGSSSTNRSSIGGWNGGGNGANTTYSLPSSSPYVSGAGGGATDVRIEGNNFVNRIIVAGGGGGKAYYPSANGAGGGLNGISSGNSDGSQGGALGSSGGTQSSGGIAYSGTTIGGGGSTIGQNGSLGQGGSGGINVHPGGGGGGGYYGGASGSSGTSGVGGSSGSGGSSFISGHTGCNAVNSSGSHTGQPNHYSGYIFTDSQMIAGNTTMPNPSGGTEVGHSGHGYARITFISE